MDGQTIVVSPPCRVLFGATPESGDGSIGNCGGWYLAEVRLAHGRKFQITRRLSERAGLIC